MTIGNTNLATYTFTGTNGTTPPAVGTTVLDSNPTPAQIQTNKCQFTGNFTGNLNKLRLLNKASMSAAPVRVDVDLSTMVGGFQGVFFHDSGAVGSESGYWIYFDSGNVVAEKWSAGAFSSTIIPSTYIGGTWANYQTGTIRFEFDVSGSNVVLNVRSSIDSFATVQTGTDSTSALTGIKDIEYWSGDNNLAISTIDNVVITGTGLGSSLIPKRRGVPAGILCQ